MQTDAKYCRKALDCLQCLPQTLQYRLKCEDMTGIGQWNLLLSKVEYFKGWTKIGCLGIIDKVTTGLLSHHLSGKTRRVCAALNNLQTNLSYDCLVASAANVSPFSIYTCKLFTKINTRQQSWSCHLSKPIPFPQLEMIHYWWLRTWIGPVPLVDPWNWTLCFCLNVPLNQGYQINGHMHRFMRHRMLKIIRSLIGW